MHTEKHKLLKLNSFIIIEYIKSSINILVDLKVKEQLESFFTNFNPQSIPNNDINLINIKESIDYDLKERTKSSNSNNEKSNNSNSSFHNDYEDLLRKHESDIRNHIKVQHQYRIYSDNLKNKIEELERSKAEYKKTVANLQEVTNQLIYL